jgi:hypothetical protein
MYIGLFIAGIVAFWVTSFLDHKSSLKQVPYGLAEGDIWKINRDQYGYYSPANFWKWHLIYFAVWTALALVLYFLAESARDKNQILLFMSLIGYFPAAAAFFIRVYLKTAKAKYSREQQQIPILKQIRLAASPEDIHVSMVGRVVGGRARYFEFPWLYVDGAGSKLEAAEQLQKRVLPELWKLSQQPESTWFNDTRMRAM